jgi:nickel/cobalt transporter (NiCoT) family protein
VTRAVRKPWQMFPTGILYGLGFDTVSEIGLLVIAGGAVAANLPWWAVLTLPILFAAGMSLLDTLDGAFMNIAYGWAFARPVRKIYYNITVTALSVAVALIVGGLEISSLLTGVEVDLNLVGYGIVLLFVATWFVSVTVWKVGRIDERWSSRLRPEL